MVAPPAVVTATNKVKRAFDVSTAAQEAALASLERRRRDRSPTAAERGGRATSSGQSCEAAGLAAGRPALSGTSSTPRPAPTRARCSRRSCAEGVIVRPLARLRCTDGDPGHLRHARRERVLRRGARARTTRRRGALGVPPRAALPRSSAGGAPLVLELQAPLHLLPGFRARDLAGGDRAHRRRLRPDPLGHVGDRPADRRLPARGRDRAAARPAGRPALAEAAARRRRRRPPRSSSCCSPSRSRRARSSRSRCVAGVATGFARPAAYAGLPNLVSLEDLPARERAAAARRAADDHRRDAARRRDRRRGRTGPGLRRQRGQLRGLGRAAAPDTAGAAPGRAEPRAAATGRTWATASGSSFIPGRSSPCSSPGTWR